MNDTVIDIKNLSKQYRLGAINTGTLSRDITHLLSNIFGFNNSDLRVIEPNTLKEPNNQKNIWALKDINLTIKRGEIIGIIGNNGAGKSTLLKILSRITAPTNGKIKIRGRVSSLLEVGTGFHPELTGLENIFLNGAILGMTRLEISNKINEIIEFSGIKKYVDTPIKRYSSGMKVRLGFSVAAHLNSDILFVDEVLAVGDAEFREKAIEKMNDLSKKSYKTILFVSHNLQAILQLTNKCIYLENGEIKDINDTKIVVQKYLETIGNTNNVIEFPRNKFIKFNYIKIHDGNGIERKSFLYDEEIFISYDYILLKKPKQFRIAFNVSDSYGNILFNSADYLDGNREPELSEVGSYKALAILPKNFFNEGRIIIGVSSDIPFKNVCLDIKNFSSIDIVFDNQKTANFKERFEGVLFPKIKWKTSINKDP